MKRKRTKFGGMKFYRCGEDAVAYTAKRAKWLERAAAHIMEDGVMSDDGEMDWKDEHNELSKSD